MLFRATRWDQSWAWAGWAPEPVAWCLPWPPAGHSILMVTHQSLLQPVLFPCWPSPCFLLSLRDRKQVQRIWSGLLENDSHWARHSGTAAMASISTRKSGSASAATPIKVLGGGV